MGGDLMSNSIARANLKRRITGARPTISRLFREGYTVTSIAHRLGVHPKTLDIYLRDWKLKPPMKNKLDPFKDYIITNYRNRTLSVERMAKKLGVTAPQILNALRNWGVERKRGFYRKKTEIINNNKQQIIDLYTNKKWTTAMIAKKFKLADCTVQLKLKEWGVPARSYTKAIPCKVKALYDQGLSPEEIGEKLKVNTSSVYKTLVNKFGIKHTKKVQFNLTEDLAIKQLINQGLSVPLARKRFNQRFNRTVTDAVFRRRMDELSIKANPKIRKQPRRGNKAYTPEQKERFLQQIRTLRMKGTPLKKIAAQIGISVALVQRIIKENDIPRVNRVYTPEVRNKVEALYDQGFHYKDIADKLGLVEDSVRQELTRMGVPRFTSKWNRRFTIGQENIQNENIRRLYKRPFYASMTRIADLLRIDKTTVKARLKEMGIPIKSTKELKRARESMLKPIKSPYITRKDRKILGHLDQKTATMTPEQTRRMIIKAIRSSDKPLNVKVLYENLIKEGYDKQYRSFMREINNLIDEGLFNAKRIDLPGGGRTTNVARKSIPLDR
jgi:transposase-like protein